MSDLHLKVLLCMHMPPPVHGAAVVGQQIHDSQLIRDSFDCSFVNYSTSGTLAEIGRFSIRKIVSVLQFIKSIRIKIQSEKPQLVYLTPSLSGWAFYRDWLMVRMIKRQKCSVVAHFHNKPSLSFTRKWYNQLLYRSFFNGLHSIFLSNCLAETFKEYLRPQLVHICPNGMPDNVQNTPSEHVHNPYTFLFLSNMMEEKGVIVLLEACALLKKRGCDFICNFLGQWSDITEHRFISLTEEQGLSEYVHAYGGVYGEEKAKYFARADAFVFPTYYSAECLPLVLIEAMQYSLPVISTPEGGISDMIDNKVGYLLEQRNSTILADKMQYLIEHPLAGREMGKNGRLKYESMYNLHIFELRLKKIFLETIKE